MNILSKNLILLTALAVTAFANAQTKISVVDVEDAILRSDYSQERIEELQAEANYKQLLAEFNSIQSDLEALQVERQNNSAKWDAKKRAEFQERVAYLREDYESSAKKLNAKQKQVYQEIVAALQDRAKIALEEIIKEEKIGLLLDAKATLLKTPEFDITDKLVRKLNKIPQ